LSVTRKLRLGIVNGPSAQLAHRWIHAISGSSRHEKW
jgi:hypothetical protein